MFVDDFMAVLLRRNWDSVRTTVTTVCQSLLGSKAISEDKTQIGQVLDFIGCEIDLINQRVGIAHHCFLKAVYLYFEVDTEASVSLRQLQQLGSLSSRYSEICVVMLSSCSITEARCSLSAVSRRRVGLFFGSITEARGALRLQCHGGA
jgi:hypothetical protein